jgi:hypothetical protein
MDWFIAHLIRDYIVQNDWMAKGKKRSSWICGIHCLLYKAAIGAFTFWPWWALVIVFVTHFAQDRGNLVPWLMRVGGKPDFMQPPMAPWSFIVIDNVLHLVVLYGLGRIIAGTWVG